MQNRGRSRDHFFDPFSGFRGFGSTRDLMSSLFSRDPFDDPFFTRPFDSTFGSTRNRFEVPITYVSTEHEPQQPGRSKGPVIEEILTDEEEEKKEKPGKHSRASKEPFVQEPDEEHEVKNRHVQSRKEYNRAQRPQSQTHSYSFQSCSVTYGGVNGAYYTSSKARRTGGDGVIVEESKEADATTGKTMHRISKGIHEKGHSVTRKLNYNGNVDTVQTLHNLNEDELAGFEEDWKGNARQHLPGWDRDFTMLEGHMGTNSTGHNGRAAKGWNTIPSTMQTRSETKATSNVKQIDIL